MAKHISLLIVMSETLYFKSIVEFGASCEASDNSSAFAKAFEKEGSFISVPAGVWYTGPITLKSNSTLNLEKGCTIKMIDTEDLYVPVYSRWEGVRCWCMHPCVYSENSQNVKVTGEGTIDGSGELWWEKLWDKRGRNADPETDLEKQLSVLNPDYLQQPGGGGGRKSQFLRPTLVHFNNCNHVVLSGVTLINSPCWTVNPVFCHDVLIEGITIDNPKDSPNTDGIDIDSCESVVVRNCKVSVGDDGICVKSGSGKDGVECNFPTENVVVENCYVEFAHGGAVVGSETAAGFKNITFRDCVFNGTDRGVRIKTRRGRGGIIDGVYISNLKVENCLCPIAFNMYYKCGTDDESLFSLDKQEITSVTPEIKNVVIENIYATKCKSSAGFIVGLPEREIKNVTIKDCYIELDSDNLHSTDESDMFRGIPHIEDRGIRVRNAEVKFENVKVKGLENPIINA